MRRGAAPCVLLHHERRPGEPGALRCSPAASSSTASTALALRAHAPAPGSQASPANLVCRACAAEPRRPVPHRVRLLRRSVRPAPRRAAVRPALRLLWAIMAVACTCWRHGMPSELAAQAPPCPLPPPPAASWLTVAERKRAQSLPDALHLFGSLAEKGLQVGARPGRRAAERTGERASTASCSQTTRSATTLPAPPRPAPQATRCPTCWPRRWQTACTQRPPGARRWTRCRH